MFPSIGESYVSHILYDEPSSRVIHDDPLHYSWAPWSNLQFNVGTSNASIDSSYTSSYVDYLFDRTKSGSHTISRSNLLEFCLILFLSSNVIKLICNANFLILFKFYTSFNQKTHNSSEKDSNAH